MAGSQNDCLEVPETDGIKNGRHHEYHAEATALSGCLQIPLKQIIHPQAFAKLPVRGGYLAQQAKEYRLESVISYKSAHTQVTGNPETKDGHGWSTLATSVVEGLNILDVITADRVVAQISTEHPIDGYVPHISFLGTRFENLRIAGHKVELDLDLDLLGPKPDDDAPYTKSSGFVKKVTEQHARLRAHEGKEEHRSLLNELRERYNRGPESFASSDGDEESVECSLVNKAEGEFPGQCFGHVIHVPNFGTIHLAKLKIIHKDRHPEKRTPRETHVQLDMIHAQMGCLATGNTTVGHFIADGHTKP